MDKTLYFDVCAVILLIILLYSIFSRKITHSRTNRYFIVLLIVILLSAIFDIWSEAYGTWVPATSAVSPLRLFLFYGYFLTHNLSALLYVLYLISLTDTWHIIAKKLSLKLLLIVPYMIIIITLLSNLVTHQVFYLDDSLNYTRGSMLTVLYVCASIYIIYGAALLIVYRRLFSRNKFIALFLLFPLEIFAVVIQLIFPWLLIEIFLTTVAHLLILITIQRPEENIDTITGIGNYYAYTSDLKKALANKKDINVILIKFTNYLSIHSVLGFDAYNGLLKQITRELIKTTRKTGSHASLYYIDRGRFALISGNRDLYRADELARHIEAALNDRTLSDSLNITMHPCLCQFNCPKEINDLKTLISFGEKFYKMLKNHNGIIHVGDIDPRVFHLHNELDTIIQKAIVEKKFEMYYQPIYSVKENKFASAEALIRLNDEKYGFIPPALFITEAEKNGTIHQIGDFVFESVCSFIASDDFQKSGLDYIEINVSVAQYMQANLADNILQILKKHNISSDKINLEITETAFNSSQYTLMQNINKLSRAGFTFSLDDYGTGYSNIQRVVSMPLKMVKLDKSIVDGIHNTRMWSVITNTIKMLKDMNMEIVVEGIETEDVAKQFSDLNCEFIQGYYYSRPLPQQNFVAFCQSHQTNA